MKFLLKRIFWSYGFIGRYKRDKPARKNRFTGKVQILQENETFQQMDWYDVDEKYWPNFGKTFEQ